MTRSGGTPRVGFDAGGVEDEVVFGRVEDADVLVDELHHVLVGGDDVDVVAERGELAGEGADDVVGLEALVVEDGDAEGFERAADVGQLLGEVGRASRRGWPCSRRSRWLSNCWVLMLNFLTSFISRGALVAEDGGADVVDGGEVLRGEVLAQLVDHVDEDIGGGGGDAGARGHGALALHGVIGAEDEGHACRAGRWGACRRFGRIGVHD